MFARMLSTDTIRAHAKSLAALAVLLVFAVAALPALAQQQEQAAPYGHGHVIWGWHPFMIVGPIFVLLAIIGIMVIFVWLVRWATQGYPFYGHGFHHVHGGCPYCGGPGRGRAALDILDERFAKGEIDKAEFEEKRKLLDR
jgi:putative membrane protein